MNRFSYGEDEAQFGELWQPAGDARPGVVVVLHGGFWRAHYDLALGRPLAADLTSRGYVVWNLEYRRVARGGGWPGTLADVAAGIDRLADLGVDVSSVVTVGHSAGGQLAVWAAAGPRLPVGAVGAVGASPRVRVTAAVSQAGVLDLATAARQQVGGTAVPDLLGGMPDDVPDRYAVADPMALLPPPVPVLCVHPRADETVPFALSEAYAAAASAAGGQVALREVSGDHMGAIDPAGEAWRVVADALPQLMRGSSC
jgi:acetyl esterase/lipase